MACEWGLEGYIGGFQVNKTEQNILAKHFSRVNMDIGILAYVVNIFVFDCLHPIPMNNY